MRSSPRVSATLCLLSLVWVSSTAHDLPFSRPALAEHPAGDWTHSASSLSNQEPSLASGRKLSEPSAISSTTCKTISTFDTTLDFTGVTISRNNLGQLDDPSQPNGLVYQNVGVNAQTNRSLDIEVINTTFYDSTNTANNGVDGAGVFCQINLRAPLSGEPENTL